MTKAARARTLAGLLAALASACSSVVPGGHEDLASYFPMDADRVWEYRLSDLSQAATWPVAVRSRGPRFVPELGRVAVIFDEQYADQVVPVAFFRHEGFLQSDIGLGQQVPGAPSARLGTQPMRLLPVSPRPGMRWTYTEEIFGLSSRAPAAFMIRWRGAVESFERVEVPAGVFSNCLRVVSIAVHLLEDREDSTEYRYSDWYAPGVGLVRSEYAIGTDRRTITRLELLRHDRRPGASKPGLLLTSPPRSFLRWQRPS